MTIIASQRNKLKNMCIELHVQIESIWKRKITLINKSAQINYISDVLTKKWRLRDVDKSFIKTKAFQKNVITFINIYEAKIRIRDDVAREHVFIQIFYAFSKVFQNVIVKLFWMMKTNSHVDWTTLTWRFEINSEKITIQFFKDFLDFDDKMFVYALICIMFDVEITFEMRRLLEALKSYENCFDFKNAETLSEHEDEDHIIDLMFGTKPSYESLYIFSEIEFNVLKNYLLKNLILNRIREFISRASASMLFVFKKNDNFRLCVDYKELNALIIKNKCSLLLIDETLDRLVSAAYFIKLSFKNAYHRIKIRKSDEWIMTFRTRYDHFEYTIMSFEFVNAFVTFQILINKILRELINHICMIYLDDILIYFKTREKHWKCVRKMLERLCQFKLYAKLSKCFFMIQMIEFLEYIISNHDDFMNLRRMKIIQTWFEFRTLRELQIFLKFANFYRRFVRFYVKITRILTELFKKNKQERQNESFIFEEAARQAFRRLIKTFTKAFMLIHFNLKNLIRIKIDTSEFVIAAILFQFITLVTDVKQTQ